MRQVRLRRIAARFAIAAVLALSSGMPALAADDVAALNRKVEQLYGQGKYNEATVVAEKALALGERMLGELHPDTLTIVRNLGLLYKVQGRYSDAELLFLRVLDACERGRGRKHPDTLTSVDNLAELYFRQGRYTQVEPLYRRVLEAREQALGREHPDTLTIVNNLGLLYHVQGRYGDAEPLYRRVLEARERALGREHPDTLTIVNNLGLLYHVQGRYGDAEPLYRRVLEARERALGREHPDTLTSVNNLAELYFLQDSDAQAEPLIRRALEACERVLGREHPDTLRSISNLARLYVKQYRYAQAEPLLRRVLETRERALGGEHPETLRSIDALAGIYGEVGNYALTEQLYRRALEARERLLGREHPNTLHSINNLATLYARQERYAEAEPLFKRTLETMERVLGRDHPGTLTTLNSLAAVYHQQGRYAQAEPLLRHALEAEERVLGRDHPDTLKSLTQLALLYFAQGDWTQAAQFWRRSTAEIARRSRRLASDADQSLTGTKITEARQMSWQFWGFIKVVHRLAPNGRAPDEATSREMFQTAQWALSSEAAQSLAQMAARGAKDKPALTGLVRERQDKLGEWQKRNFWRNNALGQEAGSRAPSAEAENAAELAALERRLDDIDQRLAVDFPDYATLANPQPLSVEDAQKQIGADEALVLFLDTQELKPTPEETFIWVVTRSDVRWVRSDLGTAALVREVLALRCGLDRAAWEGQSRCLELTGQDRPGSSLPFERVRAHRLYKALFGQVEDLIKGKHLLIVPSGALMQLPFAALVTAPPANGDRKTAWLARDHAITVLPAVSSLKALRATGHQSAATRPLIGFGNPLLEGGGKDSPGARLARQKQSCPKTAWPRVAGLLGSNAAVSPIETRGGLADVSFIRRLAPLPETADELCAVGSDVGADIDEIRLGARATEREVKRMSEHGELAKYRVVHFATHAAMAGELRGSSEPGLILTPPENASEDDDGYLSASEIATLKLDADWVILSACNTAAGQAPNAEALSGLARAFIYAQARALLVSHWAVDSNAAVKLITSAMREIARDKTVSRAEALRRAMLALIDSGAPQEAHPAYWAPFIIVGEGTR